MRATQEDVYGWQLYNDICTTNLTTQKLYLWLINGVITQWWYTEQPCWAASFGLVKVSESLSFSAFLWQHSNSTYWRILRPSFRSCEALQFVHLNVMCMRPGGKLWWRFCLVCFPPSNALKDKLLNHGDFFDAHLKRGSQKFESALVHFLSQNFYSNKVVA